MGLGRIGHDARDRRGSRAHRAGYGSVTTGSSVLSTTNYLYATDFTGTTGTHGIDVFDSTFNSVTGTGGLFNGKFSDPNLPAGFEPFSILGQFGTQQVIIVAYARPSGTGGLAGAAAISTSSTPAAT